MRKQTDVGEQIGYHLDENKMVLRYTSALRDKASLNRHVTSPDGAASQYAGFRERGVVAEDDAFIVAINAGKIPDADIEWDMPVILRALFPIAQSRIRVPIDSDEAPSITYPFRDSVSKADGASVRTDNFLDAGYANVSAVLFSPAGIWNCNGLTDQHILFVHNPSARVPIPRGAFRLGREYWLEEDGAGARIAQKDWRMESLASSQQQESP